MAGNSHTPVMSVESHNAWEAARIEAERVLTQYDKSRKHVQLRYQLSEMTITVASAGIVILGGVTSSGNSLASSVLGALVLILSSIRQVFRWGPDIPRLGSTGMDIFAELRLYRAHVKPYNDVTTAPELLLRKLNTLQKAETRKYVGEYEINT
jgi:hypothetical protein